MFNLTAYVEGNEIVVKTLNDFYADGNTIDLSSEKSIDLDNNRCNRISKWFCWCF